MVVEWHLSVGNVNVDLSLILDGYPIAGVNVVARDLWFGVGGAAVNYASCIVRLGGRRLLKEFTLRLKEYLGGDSIAVYINALEGESVENALLLSEPRTTTRAPQHRSIHC